MVSALLVEDDSDSLFTLDAFVRSQNLETTTARSLADARRELRALKPDFAIVDVGLPDGNGADLAEELAAETTVVMISGDRDPQQASRMRGLGVTEFLTKPLDLARLERLLTCTTPREGRRESRTPKILGESSVMRGLLDDLDRAANSEETVLILGETGVGKELVAGALHGRGPRASEPFVAVNCGAIPESLIESELFGHERGSFTGAHKRHVGVFERADGGTLFLDEVTELPLHLQVRLLRVLERGVVTRVGGDRETRVDVRVVAACNRDPAEAVARGFLREDLLYRLHVLCLEVPPLRERGQDVELLARTFLTELNRSAAVEKTLSGSALDAIRAHDWPGNVRELQNVMRRAHVFANREIDPAAIRLLPRTPESEGPSSIRVGMTLEEAEKRLVLATLERHGGDKRKAAEILGVSLKTIYNRLHKYGLLS